MKSLAMMKRLTINAVKAKNLMKNNRNIIFFLIIAMISFLTGYHFGIGNQSLKYGDTGLPKNCRALITDNIEGYSIGTYSAEETIYSIARNCGPDGYIWNER